MGQKGSLGKLKINVERSENKSIKQDKNVMYYQRVKYREKTKKAISTLNSICFSKTETKRKPVDEKWLSVPNPRSCPSVPGTQNTLPPSSLP